MTREPVDGVPGARTGAEVVLVVDDEEVLRKLFSRTLQDQGYRVVEAADGQAALDLCQDPTRAIDLVITDVVMPLMSGPELASRLDSVRPGMKLIYMSGYLDNHDVGRTSPHAGYLQKPFGPDALVAKVREVLSAEVAHGS